MTHRLPPPLRPRADLMSREVGDGVIIVDERTLLVHHLTGSQAVVWEELQQGGRHTLPDEVVAGVVAQLFALDLLNVPDGMDRRRLLQRAGTMGAVTIVTLALAELPAFASARKLTATPSTFSKNTTTATTTLTGAGFLPNTTITFTFTSKVTAVAPVTVVSGANGSFSQLVTITYSNGTGSSGSITASDGAGSATVPLTFI